MKTCAGCCSHTGKNRLPRRSPEGSSGAGSSIRSIRPLNWSMSFAKRLPARVLNKKGHPAKQSFQADPHRGQQRAAGTAGSAGAGTGTAGGRRTAVCHQLPFSGRPYRKGGVRPGGKTAKGRQAPAGIGRRTAELSADNEKTDHGERGRAGKQQPLPFRQAAHH